ncbi:hypothetical protein AB0C10_15070 [Microbispora amethystogenes]|uniref:hypothetical protein n=1 Tax=Microbispora amethystogenes TaxID=1427754 RepID=UPI0033EDB21F
MSVYRRLRRLLAREVTFPRGLGIAALALALVVGGLVTVRLGLGDVRLALAEGHARLNGPGVSGTFQPDDGPAVLLPAEIPWTDGSGSVHHGGRPACLWDRDPSDGMNRIEGARVQAGYRWVETPGETSYPLVMWLRCP